jgi:anti-anti-sigma factor
MYPTRGLGVLMDLEWLVDIPPEEPPALRVEADCDDAEHVRMVVSGELDAVGAVHLLEAVVEVLRHHRPRLIEMDLGGVMFLDAGGTRALVHCQADARQVHCRIRLTHTRPAVYRVLRLTGLLADFGVTGAEPSDDRGPQMSGGVKQQARGLPSGLPRSC